MAPAAPTPEGVTVTSDMVAALTQLAEARGGDVRFLVPVVQVPACATRIVELCIVDLNSPFCPPCPTRAVIVSG